MPVQRREGQGVAEVTQKGQGPERVRVGQVDAHQEAGVGVSFQCTPLLKARISSSERAGMIWSPSRSFSRAAKSGRFAERGRAGRGGGVINATILPRLLTFTCSPSSTQFRTVPKSCRM